MKAKELIAILQKNPELEFTHVQITTNGKLDGDKKLMTDFVHVFGKFEKKMADQEIYLRHQADDLNVSIYEYDSCKIVGKIIKEIPVSNCQIESGEVRKEDVIFTEATFCRELQEKNNGMK